MHAKVIFCTGLRLWLQPARHESYRNPCDTFASNNVALLFWPRKISMNSPRNHSIGLFCNRIEKIYDLVGRRVTGEGLNTFSSRMKFFEFFQKSKASGRRKIQNRDFTKSWKFGQFMCLLDSPWNDEYNGSNIFKICPVVTEKIAKMSENSAKKCLTGRDFGDFPAPTQPNPSRNQPRQPKKVDFRASENLLHWPDRFLAIFAGLGLWQWKFANFVVLLLSYFQR